MEYIRPVDFSAFKPNEFHSQRLSDPDTGVDSCVLISTRVPPGGSNPHPHTHIGDQFFFILRGKMNLQLYDRHYKLEPNTLAFIPAGVPHWNWNDSDEEELHFELIVPAERGNLGRSFRTKVDVQLTPTEPGDHYVRKLDESKWDPTRFSSQIMASRDTGSAHCRINLIQVPPGKGGPGLHIHTFDQIYYVISGTMNLQIGNEKFTAGPDTFVLLPKGVPHANWNEGTEMEKHIAVLVPELPAGSKLDHPVHLEA